MNIYDQLPVAPPSPLAEEKKNKRTLWRIGNGIGFGFVAMRLAQYGISYFIGFLLRVFPNIVPFVLNFKDVAGEMQMTYTTDFSTILSISAYIIGFTVAIIVSKVIINIPARVAFPLRKVPIGTMLAAIFICLAAVQIGAFITDYLAFALSDFTGYTPEMPDFGSPEGVFYNVLYFINIAVCAAFFEEFLCRGVILQGLRPYGDNFALIVSAIVFGIMHGNLAQAPYAIVVGLVLGYFVLYTDSLWPAMIAHLINNGMGVIQEWTSNYTTFRQDMFIYSGIRTAYVVFGIIGLIYLRTRYGSLFYVKQDSVPMKKSTKYIILFSSIGMLIFLLVECWDMYRNLLGLW